MDELSVADKGTTGHFLTLDSSCDNKKNCNNFIPHPHAEQGNNHFNPQVTTLQNRPPIEEHKAHLFIDINKYLLSIGTFFDHGFEAVFDDKTVLIIDKGNRGK